MFKKLPIILLAFLLLFSPPLVPVRVLYLLAAFSVIMLLTVHRREIGSLLKKSRLIDIMKLFGIMVSASIVVGVINVLAGSQVTISEFIVNQARILTTSPLMIAPIAYFLILCKRKGYDIYEILMVIIYAALVQSIIAIVAFLVPSIKAQLVTIMQHNVGDVILYQDWISQNRLYGFARDLFDHFGYGMGIIASLPIIVAYGKKNLKYLLLIPIILTAIFLNARTGIVVFIIMAASLGLYIFIKNINLKKIKINLKPLISLVIIALVISLTINYIAIQNPLMVSNAVSDFSSVFQFVSSGDIPTYNSTGSRLFSDGFWSFPDTPFSLLLGTGHGAYKINSQTQSDAGYVNDVWMYGIVGAILIYTAIIYITLKIRHTHTLGIAIAVALLISFFVYQVKGTGLWSANMGILMHILLISVFLCFPLSNKKREVHA